MDGMVYRAKKLNGWHTGADELSSGTQVWSNFFNGIQVKLSIGLWASGKARNFPARFGRLLSPGFAPNLSAPTPAPTTST
jgi:hypothetical protein